MTKGYSRSLSAKVGHRPNLSWCGVMLQGTVRPLTFGRRTWKGGTLPSTHADGHEVVAQQWLDHGADVAAASHDVVTALRAAANGGREAVAERLLDHGAEVTAARHEGATTLRAAAQGDHEAVDQSYWTMVPMWPLQDAGVRVRGGLLLVVAVRQWPSCSSPCGADVACDAGCSSRWS